MNTVLCCPEYAVKSGPKSHSIVGTNYYCTYSYTAYSGMSTALASYPYTPLRDFLVPEKKILLIDGAGLDNVGSQVWVDYVLSDNTFFDSDFFGLHNKRENCFFIDGHAEAVLDRALYSLHVCWLRPGIVW